MKLKQLFKSTPLPKKVKVKEAAEGACGGKTKTKSEDEEMTAITDKDYATWCNHIGMKGQKVSANEFKDAAWEVLDNDPKLEAASESEKAKIVSKLWKIHQGK